MQTEEQRDRFRRRSGGRRAFGVSLVLVGLLLFAQQAGFLMQHKPGGVWTLIPAVVGLVHLFEPGRRALGLTLLAWGLLLSAHHVDLLPLHRSWPLMLVAGGAGVLVQGLDRRTRSQRGEN